MIGFVLNFEESSNAPKYIQLYEYIKKEILSGNIKKGEKLPSIRSICQDLKISKSTAENAYQQLLVEGYILSKTKSGYFVAPFDIYAFNMFDKMTPAKVSKPLVTVNELPFNKVDSMEEGTYHFGEWKRAVNKVLEYDTKQLLYSGDAQGEFALRVEIARFIHQSRGGYCHPDQIVVGAGIQVLFGLIATLFRGQHQYIAFEYPGFAKGMYIFEDYGYQMIKVPVEKDGIDVKRLEISNVGIVYVSPSHQYPTGSVMPIKKRLQLLNWASKNNAYIIEDDYDSMLRYEGYPVPALQGLNQGKNVIYVGSFSKLLMPSLRISFMILPEGLLNDYNKVKSRYSQTVSKIDQLALACYMEEGSFERHIRRVKKIYGRKNQILIDAFKRFENESCKLIGKESGLHVVLLFDEKVSLSKVVELCKKEGIFLEGEKEYESSCILVFPYSNVADSEMFETVRVICSAAQLSREV